MVQSRPAMQSIDAQIVEAFAAPNFKSAGSIGPKWILVNAMRIAVRSLADSDLSHYS
jgi:hypothetical protein